MRVDRDWTPADAADAADDERERRRAWHGPTTSEDYPEDED